MQRRHKGSLSEAGIMASPAAGFRVYQLVMMRERRCSEYGVEGSHTRLSRRASRATAKAGIRTARRGRVEPARRPSSTDSDSEPESRERGRTLSPPILYLRRHQQVNHEHERIGPASLETLRWSAIPSVCADSVFSPSRQSVRGSLTTRRSPARRSHQRRSMDDLAHPRHAQSARAGPSFHSTAFIIRLRSASSRFEAQATLRHLRVLPRPRPFDAALPRARLDRLLRARTRLHLPREGKGWGNAPGEGGTARGRIGDGESGRGGRNCGWTGRRAEQEELVEVVVERTKNLVFTLSKCRRTRALLVYDARASHLASPDCLASVHLCTLCCTWEPACSASEARCQTSPRVGRPTRAADRQQRARACPPLLPSSQHNHAGLYRSVQDGRRR